MPKSYQVFPLIISQPRHCLSVAQYPLLGVIELPCQIRQRQLPHSLVMKNDIYEGKAVS
jgi:hypothetical protein